MSGNISPCKKCKQPMYWIVDDNTGRKNPLNVNTVIVHPNEEGCFYYPHSGEKIKTKELTEPTEGMISHFITCEFATHFRYQRKTDKDE